MFVDEDESNQTEGNLSEPEMRTRPQAETTPSMNAIPMIADTDRVRIRCTHCSAAYTTKKKAIGKQVNCKKCMMDFIAVEEV